jgi:hypothetical protein
LDQLKGKNQKITITKPASPEEESTPLEKPKKETKPKKKVVKTVKKTTKTEK